jgi:hypothetical protein
MQSASNPEVNYAEQLEQQVSLLLSLIPQDIIDSYRLHTHQAEAKTIKPQPKVMPRRACKRNTSKKTEILSSSDSSQDDGEESEQEGSAQDESGEEEQSEHEEPEVDVEESSAKSSHHSSVAAPKEDESQHTQRLKSLINELTMHFPSKMKDLNKAEIRTFDSLHRAIRNDQDWLEFSKTLMLYLEGIISINDMFLLFD